MVDASPVSDNERSEASVIHIGGLQKKTRQGIDRALDGNGLDYLTGRSWMELHDAAQVYFYLSAMEDKPEWFPSGQWATLQHLKQLCDDEARDYLESNTLGKPDA